MEYGRRKRRKKSFNEIRRFRAAGSADDVYERENCFMGVIQFAVLCVEFLFEFDDLEL